MKAKKILTGILACSLLCSSIVPVLAKDFEVTDDFSENIAQVVGRGVMVGDDWKTSSNTGYAYDSNIYFVDVSNGTINFKGWGGSSWPFTVNYVGDSTGLGEDYFISITMKGNSTDLSYGIRWAIEDSDEKTYYQLRKERTSSALENSNKVGFEKYAGGVLQHEEWGTTSLAFSKTVTVDIMKKDGVLTMKVYDTNKTYFAYTYTDESPLTMGEDVIPVALYAAGDYYVNYDNFVLRNLKDYTELGEPENVMYRDLAYQNIAEDGTVAFAEAAPVRRISVTAGEIAAVYGYTGDADSTTLLAEVADFTNGVWLNLTDDTAYDGVILEGTDIDAEVLTDWDAENTYIIPVGETFRLVPKVGEFAETTYTFDDAVLTEENGVFTSVAKGETTVAAKGEGGSVTFPVEVLGDMEYYTLIGQLDAYFAKIQPAMNQTNTALQEQDAEKLIAVLDGSVPAVSLENINDFRYYTIADYTETDLADLAERLLTYEAFCEEDGTFTTEHVEALLKTLENEVVVGNLQRERRASAIETILGENAELFGIDLENEYYTEYTEDCIEVLENMEFANVADVSPKFTQATVLGAFLGNLSYRSLPTILEKSQEIIGYDTEHYDAIKNKNTLAKALIAAKSNISTIEDLRDEIENYKEKTTDGGGGGTGGGGTKTPVISASGNFGIVADVPREVTIVKENVYSDVAPEHWAYESVAQLAAQKIVSGYEDGSFKPEDTISRAEFATMLVKAFGYQYDNMELEIFADASQSDWFFQSVMAARQANIMLGSDNYCKPHDAISRQEMASMIYGVIRDKGLELARVNDNTIFTDEADIAEWAYVSVMQLYKAGIMNGMDETTFAPQQKATRAQTATVVASLLNRMREAEKTDE